MPLQSYAISGRQFGQSAEEEFRGKRPTDAAPMDINMNPPGAFAKDDLMWQTTFGASLDAFLSIFNAGNMRTFGVADPSFTGIKAGVPHSNDNIIEKVGDSEQVRYMVSKGTVKEARESESIGELNEIRTVGLRHPNMMTGWGKTVKLEPTDFNPVNPRQNDDEHKLARETWKYGPIDMRWDERRQVWASYNDMIVDHSNLNLGTYILGSNTAEEGGFPFQRAKWSDAFWVLYPPEKSTSLITNVPLEEYTAELFTQTGHRWYDIQTNGVAPLSSIFIIPTAGNKFSGHLAENMLTIGNEQVIAGDAIDIKTSAHFYMSTEDDGPLAFTEKEPPFGWTKLLIHFDDTAGNWAPYAPIFGDDEDSDRETLCELLNDDFKDLVENDCKNATSIVNLCNEFKDCLYDTGIRTNSNMINIQDAIDCLEKNISAGVAAAINFAIANDLVVFNTICTKINTLVSSINTVLSGITLTGDCAVCGVSVGTVTTPEGELPQGPPVLPDFTDCNFVPAQLKLPDCEDCDPITLNVPCDGGTIDCGVPCEQTDLDDLPEIIIPGGDEF
jgi:hypothetical protein